MAGVVKRKWLDNAFWENHQKDRITGILEITDERGRKTTQVLNVRKLDDKGRENKDFHEIIRNIGRKKLDENTNERHERKQREQREKAEVERGQAKTRALEQLFEAKIQALEIDDIQQSQNTTLKRKLRQSKNAVELNMYAMMLVMEQNGFEFSKKED